MATILGILKKAILTTETFRYINESGVDPINKELLSLEQLIEVEQFFRLSLCNEQILHFSACEISILWKVVDFSAGEMFPTPEAKASLGHYQRS